MRILLFLIMFVLVVGCSEGGSTAQASAASPEAEPDVRPSDAVGVTESRPVRTPTSELVGFYLHFYDQGASDQDYALLNEVEQELITRGADSIQELLKYPYCLDRYPYIAVSWDLIEAVGPEAKVAIPRLAKSLADQRDPVMSWRTAELLVRFGSDSIPVLMAYYNGDNLRAAWAVSFPLRRLGEGVVPHMKPSIASPVEERREMTMDVLSEIGPAAADLIPDVRQQFESEPYRNKVRAARTLVNLGDTAFGLSFLFAEVDRWNDRLLAEDDPPAESFWAIVALERCRVSDARLIVEKLLETLKHPNLQRRRFAINALKPHGRDARVQAVLREILRDQDRVEEYPAVAHILGSWGDQFQLDQEEVVIGLLEQAIDSAGEDQSLGISNGLGRIKARRFLETWADRVGEVD